MKIYKQVAIASSAAKVWKVFAHDFDNANEWMSAIPISYGKDIGKKFEGAHSAGRVCELDGNPKGIKASEQFLSYDEKNKQCVVDVEFLNTPVFFPILKNQLTFSVVDTGNDQSEVSLLVESTLRPTGYLLYPIIKLGLSVFLGQIIDELKYFVENSEPHPRKVKAIEKLKKA